MSDPKNTHGPNKSRVVGHNEMSQGGLSGGMGSLGVQGDEMDIEELWKDPSPTVGTSTHPPGGSGTYAHHRGANYTDGGAGS